MSNPLNKSREPPWASGPKEILRHGFDLLKEDSDVKRRLALLSVDNAVELMIKTYLALPERVTGLKISRNQITEFSESFPKLLGAVEKHAPEHLSGVSLGEIEWFHRLRNEIYHEGNGITVEREKVAIYAQLAKILLSNLFSVEIDEDEPRGSDLLSNFLAEWAKLEKALWTMVGEEADEAEAYLGEIDLLAALNNVFVATTGDKSRELVQKLLDLRSLRNRIVRGEGDHRKLLKSEMLHTLKRASMLVQNLADKDSKP